MGTRAGTSPQFRGPKGPSWVAVELEHVGREIRVDRRPRAREVGLYVDGGSPETGESKVNEVPKGVPRVPAAIFSKHVFVKQRTTFDFLTARRAAAS